MYFRLDASVRDLIIWDWALDFVSPAPVMAKVNLRRPSPEEIGSGEGREQARCTAVHEVPEPKGFKGIVGGGAKDIALEAFPVEPVNMQGAIREIRSQIIQATLTVVNTVRWKLGIRQPYDPLAEVRFSYSFDGENWAQVTPLIQLPRMMSLPASVGEDGQALIAGMLATSHTEPVAHDILREAFESSGTNPRGSLILGVAAVEVGAKHCLSRLVEDAAWLVDNMPMPPVTEILRQYLPILLRNRGRLAAYSPPSEIVKVIDKAVEARNTFVHRLPGSKRYKRAQEQIELHTLERTLWDIDSLLWLFDLYAGFDWAANHVGTRVMQLLVDQNGGQVLPHMEVTAGPAYQGLTVAGGDGLIFTHVLIGLHKGSSVSVGLWASKAPRNRALWIDLIDGGVQVAVERPSGGERHWSSTGSTGPLYGAAGIFVPLAASLANSAAAFDAKVESLIPSVASLLSARLGRTPRPATSGPLVDVDSSGVRIDVHIEPDAAGWPALVSLRSLEDGAFEVWVVGGDSYLTSSDPQLRDEAGIVEEAVRLHNESQRLARLVSDHIANVGDT